MKGLAAVAVVLQLSFIHANVKGPTQVTEFSVIKEVNPVRIQQLMPDANSLVEIDVLKDFIADAQHHIVRKRQAGPEPGGDPAPSKKRRRRRRKRRRKKVSAGPARQPSPMPEELKPAPEQRRREQVETPRERESNVPIENILDPAPRRRERKRRPRPRPTPAVDPMPASPMLREMSKEDTNGLLRAEELQANYIKTDMMRANRLKADRIKADKIKAQDVVVTSKSRRKPALSFGEFVQLEPTYERIGTQRQNSIVDSHRLEPLHISQTGQPNYFDMFSYNQQPNNAFEAERLIERRYNNMDMLMPQQESFTNLNTRRRSRKMSHPPPVQPAEVLPDIPYATRQLLPKLSEFIAEPPSFRSASKLVKQDRIQPRNPSSFDQYAPFSDRMTFDNPEAHFKTDSMNTRSHDGTAKSYLSKADPWFFS